MFTGIIREIGIIKKIIKRPGGLGLVISASKIHAKIGASIAVNGVCLTVTKKMKGDFIVDVVPETLNRTNLGMLRIGARINLEPSMKASDTFDGHFVMGHVDAVGRVTHRENGKNGLLLNIAVPQKLMKYIVEKGSVAVNGVSLTVANAKKNQFTVALTPFTEKHTNLSSLKKGNAMNIEVDIIARYLNR